MFNDIVVIRSGGDIATAVAHKLYRSGFKILILERKMPLAIRRNVVFSEAIFENQVCVEKVICKKANNLDEIYEHWRSGIIPIIVDEECEVLNSIKADVLVDGILAKKNMNTSITMAPLTIALGPGFVAGEDVHVVIETNRGHDLGRLIYEGSAERDTGIPGVIMGYGEERVFRAPCAGKVRTIKGIGDSVKKGENILYVEDMPVKSKLDGVIRGCIRDGVDVFKGLKIGDVDPRGIVKNCDTISDKARCVAGGVLEAILYSKR